MHGPRLAMVDAAQRATGAGSHPNRIFGGSYFNMTNAISSSIANFAATASATSSASTGSGTTPEKTGVDDLANQQTFLKLLVAQMQNQNPLSPSDPMQFVSQLAQFSSLEQTIAMRSRLDDIYGALGPASKTATPAT
jgi:flagellar hook assembly protein FlgD